MTSLRLAVAGLAALTLGATAPGSAAAQRVSPQAVLDACIQGSGYAPAVIVRSVGRDRTGQFARLEAGGDLNDAQVAAINACAARHGGNLGIEAQREAAAVPRTARLSTSGGAHRGQWDSAPTNLPPLIPRSAGCPSWAPLIYRGNMYCPVR